VASLEISVTEGDGDGILIWHFVGVRGGGGAWPIQRNDMLTIKYRCTCILLCCI